MSSLPPSAEERQPFVNWEAALEVTDGDAKLLDDIVGVFLEEAPKIMADIHRSVAEKDVVLLRRSAHTLVSNARNLSCPRVGRVAQQLESAVHELAENARKKLPLDSSAVAAAIASTPPFLTELEALMPLLEAELRKRLER